MRRIQQCLGTNQYMLDLAIIPRLTKGDFGVVFMVRGGESLPDFIAGAGQREYGLCIHTTYRFRLISRPGL